MRRAFAAMLTVLLAALVPASSTAAGEPALERPGDRPDLTPYNRPLVPGERAKGVTNAALPGLLVDLVVSALGVDSNDTFDDSETSIAIDPNDPSHITISAFSGSWGTKAPLWTSTDGGATWAKSFTLPAPPMAPDASGCPCDQTYDIGRNSPTLFGTVLGVGGSDEPTWGGATTDPTSLTAWLWQTAGGSATPISHTTFSDQPWLMVGRDPDEEAQDDTYVGYTDYGASPPANHVVYSLGANPPFFTGGQDVVVGTSAGTGFLASAAIRLATDPNNGTVYAVWEDNVSLDTTTCARNVDFRIDASTDHGQTWQLNRGATGFVVATHQSDEGWPDDPNQPATACRNHVEKFGTVNALLGGSEAVAVDPADGEVYFVYHRRNAATGNNRLEVARLTPDGAGDMLVTARTFATGEVQAALPSLAIAANGTLGLLYDTYNGVVSGFPQFSTIFAQSTDHGVTWSSETLVTFLSPTLDNGNSRQRILGDYQQVKAVGNTFYAAFPANGATAGRSISNIDPFFYKEAAKSTPLAFFTLPPCRILDTRNAAGPLGGPALQPGVERDVYVLGTCGIPFTARSLSVNATVAPPSAGGVLRLFGGGAPLPNTSVMNFPAGAVLANNAVVTLASGSLAIRLDATGSTQFILDVNGYFQ
jgi:hypothetical protein